MIIPHSVHYIHMVNMSPSLMSLSCPFSAEGEPDPGGHRECHAGRQSGQSEEEARGLEVRLTFTFHLHTVNK